MNCEDFNQIINELADYKPIETTVREASVSHVALCPECAMNLANARAVSNSLLLAARAESEEAPSRIKENLLAAFANSRRQSSAPANVVDISSRRNTRSWMVAAVAIAAVILVAVAVSIWRRSPMPGTGRPGVLQAGGQRPAVTPQVDDPKPGSSPVQKEFLGGDAELSVKVVNRGPRKVKRSIHESVSERQPETVARNSNEYLPVTYLAKGMALESGTVVRVELSRSALASLGFTGSVEGSAESVTAEVILGDDGVARAIRLVE